MLFFGYAMIFGWQARFALPIRTHGGGTEIYNNFVVCGNKGDNGTMHKLRMGLYVDNNSSNFVVHHNIVIGGGQGLCANMPNQGTRFYNNTVINADVGINFYGFPVDNADASSITFNVPAVTDVFLRPNLNRAHRAKVPLLIRKNAKHFYGRKKMW